jgi:hypothetical protein
MTVSSRLLGAAGAVVGGLGTHETLLHTFYSPACLSAIKRVSEADVYSFCPPGFDNLALVNIIALCVGLSIVIFFWKDILQEFLKKVFSSE